MKPGSHGLGDREFALISDMMALAPKLDISPTASNRPRKYSKRGLLDSLRERRVIALAGDRTCPGRNFRIRQQTCD